MPANLRPALRACSIGRIAAGALTSPRCGGFLDAVDSFAAPDYWRRDAAVKSWFAIPACRPPPGSNIDAVRFYHRRSWPHGRGGNFRLPMGALYGRVWIMAVLTATACGWSADGSVLVDE